MQKIVGQAGISLRRIYWKMDMESREEYHPIIAMPNSMVLMMVIINSVNVADQIKLLN